MCGNNPNVAPQVNNAKCIGGTALGFAIVTIIGFLLDWPGAEETWGFTAEGQVGDPRRRPVDRVGLRRDQGSARGRSAAAQHFPREGKG